LDLGRSKVWESLQLKWILETDRRFITRKWKDFLRRSKIFSQSQGDSCYSRKKVARIFTKSLARLTILNANLVLILCRWPRQRRFKIW